jgi:SAM-dependent methyltransferase
MSLERKGSSSEHKMLRNPNHPIFRDSKWHYAFRLSDGTFTQTHTKDLQEWHDLRRQFIFGRIDSMIGSLDGKSCLDIACNSGFWSIELAKRGAVVEAFDHAESDSEKARAITAHYGINNVSFSVSDLFSYEPRGSYDLILCFGLIYHLTDPLGACRRIRSWSKGATVFDTAVSDLEGPVLEIGSHNKYSCCGEKEFAFVPTPEAFEAILARTGFSKLKRILNKTGAYSENTIRALWFAWP